MPLAQLLYQVPRLANLRRIEPERGFVQDENLGIVHYRIGEPQTLPHTFRQLSDRAVDELA